jgi:hypothetical protein
VIDSSPLTTNDVRVLRALVESGPLTERELQLVMARQLMGAEPAMRRLPRLSARRMVRPRRGVLDITGEGARALRAVDLAAYGAVGLMPAAHRRPRSRS